MSFLSLTDSSQMRSALSQMLSAMLQMSEHTSGTLWLSGTGFYLLFKSFSRADFRWLRRRRKPIVTRSTA